MDESEEMGFIRAFVNEYREEREINPTLGRKREPSCIMHGESWNLLYCQLIHTKEVIGMSRGDGWPELQDPEIRAGVLREIGFYRKERAA